jgi:hypothetical protein
VSNYRIKVKPTPRYGGVLRTSSERRSTAVEPNVSGNKNKMIIIFLKTDNLPTFIRKKIRKFIALTFVHSGPRHT